MTSPSPDPEWDALWNELNGLLASGPTPRADALCQLLLTRAEQMTARAEPDAAERMAAVRFARGCLAALRGRRDDSDREFRAALPFATRAVAEKPAEPARRDRLATLHYNLGNTDAAQGRHAEAETAFRTALPLQEANARERPDLPELRNRVAQTSFNLGNTCMALNRNPEAVDWFVKARDLWLKVSEEEPQVVGHAHNLARSYFNFAFVAGPAGRATETDDAYQRGQAIWIRLLNEFGENEEQRCDLARCYHNHSVFLYQSGRHEEALPVVERALPHYDRLVAIAPANPSYGQMRDQAYAQRDWLRDNPPAEIAARQLAETASQAAAARRARDWPRLRQVGSALIDTARSFCEGNRPREMEQIYRAALGCIAEAASQDQSPDTAHLEAALWFDLNIDLRSLGRYDGAEEAVRTALRRWQRLQGRFPQDVRFHHWLAGAFNNLGIICADTGRLEAAEAAYRSALAMREAAARTSFSAENQLFLGGALCNLGNIYLDRGSLTVARDFYTRAIATIEAVQSALAGNDLVGQFLKNSRDGVAACAARRPLEQERFQFAALSWALQGPPALAFADREPATLTALRRVDALRLANEPAADQASADLVRQAPDCAEAWLLRGLVLANLSGEPGSEPIPWTDERHQEAATAFYESLVCRPHYYEALLYKGVALKQAAHAAQARLRAMLSATEAIPEPDREDFCQPHRKRFQWNIGRARESLENAARLRPQEGKPWYELATLYHDLGYGAEAEPFLARLRTIDEPLWRKTRAEFKP